MKLAVPIFHTFFGKNELFMLIMLLIRGLPNPGDICPRSASEQETIKLIAATRAPASRLAGRGVLLASASVRQTQQPASVLSQPIGQWSRGWGPCRGRGRMETQDKKRLSCIPAVRRGGAGAGGPRVGRWRGAAGYTEPLSSSVR